MVAAVQAPAEPVHHGPVRERGDRLHREEAADGDQQGAHGITLRPQRHGDAGTAAKAASARSSVVTVTPTSSTTAVEPGRAHDGGDGDRFLEAGVLDREPREQCGVVGRAQVARELERVRTDRAGATTAGA